MRRGYYGALLNLAPASRDVLVRGGLPLVAGLALVLPGAPSQALAGIPLSTVGLLCAAVVVYAALALPRPGWATCRWLILGFVVVIGFKFLAASTAPPVGLQANFFPNATFAGPAERSTDFSQARLGGATRLDTALDLHAEEFAVHFFNDAGRFNFGPDVQPGRDQLAFSVRWAGWLLAPSAGDRRFVVESTGPARIWIDDTELPSSDSRVPLAAGLHALRVDYARPEARVPALTLSWDRQPGGPLVAVAGPDVRWQPSTSSADLSHLLGLIADVGLIVLVGAWCVVGLDRARRTATLTRAALGVLPLIFMVQGMLLLAPLAGRVTILSGLDDWLIYESSARDILLNGPLMDGGQGHAAPFYGQPLYPYVLAAAHWLSGESLFGPIVMQFAALGLVLVGTAVLAQRAFGSRLDGVVALAMLALLLQLEAEHFKVARQLFNENLYMPLVMASLIVVVGVVRKPTPVAWWRAVLVGALLGITAISRSQFLLFVPCVLLILLIAWRRTALSALVAVGALLVGLGLTIAPVTARNWVVSGQFVPISSSGGASLLEFHRPPAGLIDQPALQNDPLYEALHLDLQTRTVVAFARADPRAYLATWLPLGAHSIGLQGRNDPGIYWPLLLTTLLYVASFALGRARRLWIWPIHAFVITHLLVLMLFEADTYGYRLVVPMYAPMVVVAAQVPLAVVRALVGWRTGAGFRGGTAQHTPRFAEYGWALVAVAALVWQYKGLADAWSDREVALHGLGGPAALAATTADQVAAEAIYVASIDGTPRRFGAGNLPGMRYPWFKWFDPSRSVPLPRPADTAVYMLSELAGHTSADDLVTCLGPPDVNAQRVLTGAQVRQQCVGDWPSSANLGASFEGVARIDAVRLPDTVDAGEALETRLLWQPLVAHPDPQQVSVQLDDPQAADGTLWGNGTLELYPAREWDPDESVLSRIAVATDPTAIPQRYRVTVGIGSTKANAAPALAAWQGSQTDRVPVSTVALSPGSGLAGQALPADMRAIEGPPLIGGGLELIGTQPLPAEAAIGGPLRLGLLWRAMQDEPSAAQFELRLVRGNGDVVQQSALPLLGGRLAPSALHSGNVVRDEQTFVVGASVPSEPLFVDVGVLDARGAPLANAGIRLGTIKMTGRAHVFDTGVSAQAAPEATFGESMVLLSDGLEPAQAKAGDKVTAHLRWRSAATMQQAYKVFVHVLDPTGEHVVAQRDSEPQDGHAPTPGWVVGEVIQDDYTVTLPAGLAPGDYPIEVGVYDARSGDRLKLPNGDNRVILSTRLKVH